MSTTPTVSDVNLAVPTAGTPDRARLNPILKSLVQGFPSRKNFNILATGQSNMVQNPAYTWSPPQNLQEWNWPGTEGSVGTAFAPVVGDGANIARLVSAEVAFRHPGLNVNLIRIAIGGQPIAKWLGGLDFDFDTDTTEANPGAGNFRLNNANPALATACFYSQTMSDGFTRLGPANNLAQGATLRLESASNPNNFVIYTTETLTTNSGWNKILLTYSSGSGTFADGEDIKAVADPNVYPTLSSNVNAALASLGADEKIDALFWWQGESDASGGHLYYENDFEELVTRLKTDGYIDINTPIYISGTVPTSINGSAGFDLLNRKLAAIAANDAAVRKFVYPGVFPIALWDEFTAGYLHMTADGYVAFSKIWADAINFGGGLATFNGLISDPVTKKPLFPNDGAYGDPGIGFANAANIGFFNQGGSTIGVSANNMRMVRYSDDNTGAAFDVGKSRGTSASPSAVLQNDSANYDFRFQTGAATNKVAVRLNGQVTEATPTDSAVGAKFRVQTCPAGSATLSFVFTADHENGLTYGPINEVFLNNLGLHKLKRYERVNLPAATAALAGCIASVTNAEASKSELVHCTGTEWEYMDGTAVTVV